MVIFYNTKMFKDAKIDPPKADWTWDDFLATAKKLTTGSGADQVYGFGIPFFNFGLHPWWFTNGTSLLNADWSESNLADPKMLEAVQFVHDLVHVHKVSPAVEGTDTANLFTAGKLAMSGWGHWPIQGFIANNFSDFDVQYWPRKRAATSVFGVGGWGISKESKNKDLAWELIKELTSKETIPGHRRGRRRHPRAPLGGRKRRVPQAARQRQDLLRVLTGRQARGQPGQLQRGRDDLHAPYGRGDERLGSARRRPQGRAR